MPERLRADAAPEPARALLDAVVRFTLDASNPTLARFAPAMGAWGTQWTDVGQRLLPAAARLGETLGTATAATRSLLALFDHHTHALLWEQSYTRAQGLVPDAMLAGYGFAEIVGQRGPFLSERIRCGVGVWGPDIEYPTHHHAAEEAYLVLGGSALFRVGDAAERRCTAGDLVHVESNRRHGLRTAEDSLAVFYLWQAGDLRQTSVF